MSYDKELDDAVQQAKRSAYERAARDSSKGEERQQRANAALAVPQGLNRKQRRAVLSGKVKVT